LAAVRNIQRLKKVPAVMDKNEPFDVVVAGDGNAALCAAITAAR
jgi:alkyl hydroperoxide reductase subunit AhpF